MEGSRAKSRRGVAINAARRGFDWRDQTGYAKVPRNMEPTPAVKLRRKWRRVCACSNANRASLGKARVI